MNLIRGFRRIIHILSIIVAICSFYIMGGIAFEFDFNSTQCLTIAIFSVPIGYCLTWLVYYLVKWLILGFADDKTKAEQNHKSDG